MGLYFIIVLFFFIIYISLIGRIYDNCYKEKSDVFIVKIISKEVKGQYNNRYVGKIIQGKSKGFNIYLYVPKDKLFKYRRYL